MTTFVLVMPSLIIHAEDGQATHDYIRMVSGHENTTQHV